MADSDRTFTASMSQVYDDCLGPLLFAPFAEHTAALVAADGPADILETAAGTGQVTKRLAARLPRTRIVATDLNAPMLEYAQRRNPDLSVTWQTADAQELPFDADRFDAVVCQFGAMFFPDRVAAYREARRVLRPGGRFTLAIWDGVDTSVPTRVALAAARSLLPPGPAFIERVPHGYGEPDRIRADLRAGGFHDVDVERVTLVGRAASALDAARGFAYGTPLLAAVPGPREQIVEAMAAALQRELASDDGTVEGPSAAFVVGAR